MQREQFHHNNKSLEYLVKNNSGKKAVVLIHGYGASMYDLYDLHQANPGFDWYFPQGTQSLMGEMSRAWFPIDEAALQQAMITGSHRDLSEVSPEGLDDVIDLIVSFCESLSYKKIIVGGFSQGAMVSSHVFSRLHSKLDGLTLFSGNLIAKEKLNKSLAAIQDSECPVFQSHGHQDPILSYEGALRLKETMEASGVKVEFQEFQGQHEIPQQVLRQWMVFMQRCLERPE